MKRSIFLVYIVCIKITFGDERVIGGEEIEISEAPYHVSIQINDGDGFVCSGSILNKNMILTAAHPFENYTPSEIKHNITVRAGSKRFYVYGQHVHTSFDLHKHPYYNPNNTASHDYDIAILRVDTSLDINPNLNTANIQIPPLIQFGDGLPVDVTGWGTLQNTDLTLKKITIQILDADQCKKIYRDQFTDRMLCAADVNWNKHVCASDSGSPMVLQGTYLLLGITSYGNNCLNVDYPTVFTNVANNEIQSFIKRYLDLYET